MEMIPIPGFAEPISSLSHLGAALLFLVLGVLTLIKGRGSATRFVGLMLFNFFAVALFSLSGVFHLLTPGSVANKVLQILDHTAIFTMIGGTITPFHIILLRGKPRWVPLAIIWPVAVTGLTLTAIYFDTLAEGLILSVYLILGWFGLYTLLKVRQVSRDIANLICVGGVLYSIGALFDFAAWPTLITGVFTAHEVFHIFIVAAAFCHWWAIYQIASYPVKDEAVVIVKQYPDYMSAFVFGRMCVAKAADMHELKQALIKWMHHAYPQALVPSTLRFEFHREEWIQLKGS